MTSFSPQQDAALKAVAAWLRNPGRQQVFRLFGFAGTGKTTLAQHFAGGVDGPVLFGAFTGKAAHVMHKKGCRGARTIHSLIYKLDDDQMTYEPKFRLNPDSDVAGAELVIIDEVSMVGEDLGRDLLSFGTPVLVLGDPAQLPPVKGQGFFTEAEPDVMPTPTSRRCRCR
ncbi:MAG: AAA family ATPase [Hyphomonas sp.]|nr:AAA family ATPase [Hyphomonas sp.]